MRGNLLLLPPHGGGGARVLRRTLCSPACKPNVLLSAKTDFDSGCPATSITSTAVSCAERLSNGSANDLVVVGVFEEDVSAAASSLETGGSLDEMLASGRFSAKQNTRVTTRLGEGQPQLCLVGLGSMIGDLEHEASECPGRLLGAAAAAASRECRATNVAIGLFGGDPDVDAEVDGEGWGATAAGGATENFLTGIYVDERFKSAQETPPVPPVKCVELLSVSSPKMQQRVADAIDRATSIAAGVCQARRLVDGPPNIVDPGFLAAQARAIADAGGQRMECSVLGEKECAELGMGAFLSVAAASELPPQFIHLTWRGIDDSDPVPAEKRLAIIGKGVTFDSGGYNLKTGPGCMIELMKFDMGGAAATLGAARAISKLQPKGVEVHFIVAACENMISGRPGALRPGDIVRASNGKTIEVNNTDAEGRLTLADALVYATRELQCGRVVDIATLTGACVVGLGDQVAGLFTRSNEFAEQLGAAATVAGERQWRLPMHQGYWEQMKSQVADMKNAGGREGGAITAALFLEKFVEGSDSAWAHIDVAGPVWNTKLGRATGAGVGTLTELVLSCSKQGK